MKRRPSERRAGRGAAFRVAVLALGTSFGPVRLVAQVGNSGAPFLLAPIGARLTALGGAGVADPSGVDALFATPAGFARATRKEVSLEYAQDDLTKRYILSATYPAGLLGTFALAAYQQDVSTQKRTTRQNVEIATLYYRNREYAASYAAHFGGGLNAGVTIKRIEIRSDCSGNCDPLPDEPSVVVGVFATTAVDAGLQYDLPHQSPLHIGVAVRHAGFKVQVKDAEQADPLPTQFVAGAAYDVKNFGKRVPDASLRFVLDATSGIGSETRGQTAHLGAEAGYQGRYFLRAGYAYYRSGATFKDAGYGGATIGFGIAQKRFALDVAKQVTSGELLANNPPTYVGLRYAF